MTAALVAAAHALSTPTWPDLLTAVLFAWQDTPRLCALTQILHACLVQLPGDDAACNTQFVASRPLVSVCESPPRVLHPVAAVETLQRDWEALASLHLLPTPLLVDTTRATFLVLFLLDGRVRRLVLAPHKGHQLMHTRPPERTRMLAWLGGCAGIDAAKSPPVQVAAQYAEDLFLLANDIHLSPFIEADDALMAHNAAMEQRIHTITRDFVQFMAHWWLIGQHGLQPLGSQKPEMEMEMVK